MTITLWLALTWPATVRPAEGRGRSVRHSAISHRSESNLRRPASIRSGRSAGGTTSASDTTGILHVNSGYARDSSACRSSARPGAISAGSPGVATTPSVSSGPGAADALAARMAQEASSDAAAGALRALAAISSSPPARTGVSGLNDPTRTLEYIDTKHPPSHFR